MYIYIYTCIYIYWKIEQNNVLICFDHGTHTYYVSDPPKLNDVSTMFDSSIPSLYHPSCLKSSLIMVKSTCFVVKPTSG